MVNGFTSRSVSEVACRVYPQRGQGYLGLEPTGVLFPIDRFYCPAPTRECPDRWRSLCRPSAIESLTCKSSKPTDVTILLGGAARYGDFVRSIRPGCQTGLIIVIMPRMTEELDVDELAGALYRGVALIVRRLKQLQAPDELTLPQRTALARLDRGGPSSAASLARAEQITPQAMAVTLGALEKRGLVKRRPDPHDGRQVVMSLTKSGRAVLHHDRDARARQFTKVLAEKFSGAELRLLARAAPLIERLGAEL